jgi:hypothetical protein
MYAVVKFYGDPDFGDIVIVTNTLGLELSNSQNRCIIYINNYCGWFEAHPAKSSESGKISKKPK